MSTTTAHVTHALIVVGVITGSRLAMAQQDYRYAWIDLPPLVPEYVDGGPSEVNESGVAVGNAATGQLESLAVQWDAHGVITPLESLGGSRSSAGGITSAGDLIWGMSIYPNGSPLRPRAVIWRDGAITDIGSLGGDINDFVSPQGMNEAGQVVGTSDNELGLREAFVWDGIAMRPLQNLGDRRGTAFAINDLGDITGILVDEFQISQPVLWRRGTEVVLLPVVNHSSPTPAYPLAINDEGIIVGSLETQSRDTHAAAWIDDQIFDIHTPGIGSISMATDINSQGQIIGQVGLLHSHVFIRNPGEQMILLDDLVPPKIRPSREVSGVGSINDAGQIAVGARQPGNSTDVWGVVLTPVYPTMDLAAPSPGTAGASNTITATGVTPGKKVYFLYSVHGGGTRIPGCDLQQNALQLDNPTIIGSAVADGNGVAAITRHVPLLARGQTILFQAVVQDECAISQLAVHQFD